MGTQIVYPRPDGAPAPGYLATAGPNAPGVVLFEEWWGVTDYMRSVADRLSAAGFTALIPDLYRGRIAATGDEANHMTEGLDFGDATAQDGRGAAAYLRAHGSHKVGVMGYCMGGALAMLSAMTTDDFDAAVVFYGLPPKEAGDPKAIRIPVQGHWALHDDFFTIDRVDEVEAALAATGTPHEFHRYDAKHAFTNPSPAGQSGLGNYEAGHAATAWERTIAFLRNRLSG